MLLIDGDVMCAPFTAEDYANNIFELIKLCSGKIDFYESVKKWINETREFSIHYRLSSQHT